MNAVAHKIEDFFARSRLAAYDLRAATALNPSLEEYTAMAGRQLDLSSTAITTLPLAPITPQALLPLTEGVNPAWAAALRTFRDHTVAPLLRRPADALTQEDWDTLRKALAPCQQWLADRPATSLDALDEALLHTLHRSDARQRVMALIAEDEAEQTHNEHTKDLEKLLRFKRDLLELLNNFVSFSAFYQRKGAIFQAGTLYLDARSCDLTVQVTDAAQHAKLGGLAKTYLAYCQCTRKGQKMGIVAAFTAGDVDFLFVGRNGVFYDRKGLDWDATITRIVENPTSISQAFLSPYKKFVRLIEEQVAKRAAAGEARAQKSLGTTASSLANTELKTISSTADTVTAAAPRRTDVGTVAAIGVALGSISAVAVGIFAKVVDLGVWIPLGLMGIVLAISGPSMLIAWLKLHQRSLGPLLDASGWAINGRMRINTRLGGSLSQTAKVPANARRTAHAEGPVCRIESADVVECEHLGRTGGSGHHRLALALAGPVDSAHAPRSGARGSHRPGTGQHHSGGNACGCARRCRCGGCYSFGCALTAPIHGDEVGVARTAHYGPPNLHRNNND